MKMSKIKKLNLPLAQENKLLVLKEKELRIEELLRNYDPYWIERDLQDVEEQLAEVVKKREAIIKRKTDSVQKGAELNHQLKSNQDKQTGIIMQHGILGKLRKAAKIIEEVENGLALQTQDQ